MHHQILKTFQPQKLDYNSNITTIGTAINAQDVNLQARAGQFGANTPVKAPVLKVIWNFAGHLTFGILCHSVCHVNTYLYSGKVTAAVKLLSTVM